MVVDLLLKDRQSHPTLFAHFFNLVLNGLAHVARYSTIDETAFQVEFVFHSLGIQQMRRILHYNQFQRRKIRRLNLKNAVNAREHRLVVCVLEVIDVIVKYLLQFRTLLG